MKKLSLIFCLIFSCITLKSHSQSIITAEVIDINQDLKKQLDAKITSYQLIRLSAIPKQASSLKFQIQLPESVWDVNLLENEIRTPELIEQENKKTNKPYTTCPTYTGKVNKNDALFYIDRDTFSGKVYLEDDAICLEPLSWSVGKENSPNNVWILYLNSKTIAKQRICGTKSGGEKEISTNRNLRTTALPAACKMLKVAVEFDNEFENLGGVGKALTIMQEVDKIYFRDLKLRVNVSWIRNWNNASDPYTNATLFFTVSAEFWSHWDNQMGYVNRDCTHMFTGKTLTVPIGSGDINGESNAVPVGSSGKSYSMSDAGMQSSDWQACASHEIAHNSGHYGHDEDLGTNVDCNANRFIMCGGSYKQTEFSPSSKNIIIPFLDANTSLGIRIPPILAQSNYSTIISTPQNIPSGGSSFNILNNDPYIY